MKRIMKSTILSTYEVEAILEGRKTQTRRRISGQPFDEKSDIICQLDDFKTGYWGAKFKYFGEERYEITNLFKPLAQIGDVLWVRETWQDLQCFDYNMSGYAYKADKHSANHAKEFKITWKPSIFMPKEAARIFLEVTNVRVERLQDISEVDAIDEGIEPLLMSGLQLATQGQQYRNYLEKPKLFNDGLTAKSSFQSLWESINGIDSWIPNPWVWVYDFKVIDKPI